MSHHSCDGPARQKNHRCPNLSSCDGANKRTLNCLRSFTVHRILPLAKDWFKAFVLDIDAHTNRAMSASIGSASSSVRISSIAVTRIPMRVSSSAGGSATGLQWSRLRSRRAGACERNCSGDGLLRRMPAISRCRCLRHCHSQSENGGRRRSRNGMDKCP